MPKPAVSRDAFRGLVAFCAAKAHHDHKPDGEYCVWKLFGSAQDIPDRLLKQWSVQAELLGAESIASTLEPRTREIANGRDAMTTPATFSTCCSETYS